MKIKNIFGNEYSGTIGKSITASRWKGIAYIRKYCIPGNPNSQLQENHRSLFTEAVDLFKTLDQFQKDFYNKLAVGMTGYNLFIKEYMAAYRSGGIYEAPIVQSLTVLDDNGSHLKEAVVKISKGSKNVFTGLTDQHGVVTFAVTRKDGPYDITVSGDGYTSWNVPAVCPNQFPSSASITPINGGETLFSSGSAGC